MEGFPNTFLQAWARCVPVVSFFDPDHVIKRRGLGKQCCNIEEMISSLDGLLDDAALREDIGARARAFVEGEFSPRAIATRYLELLTDTRTVPLAQEAVAARR